MYCKACGRIIPEDSEYCSYCGTNQKICEDFREESSDYAEQETENQNNSSSRAAKKIVNVAVGMMKVMVVPVIEKSVDTIAKQVSKTMDERSKKGVNKFLKKAGLKKKNPLDHVKDIFSK